MPMAFSAGGPMAQGQYLGPPPLSPNATHMLVIDLVRPRRAPLRGTCSGPDCYGARWTELSRALDAGPHLGGRRRRDRRGRDRAELALCRVELEDFARRDV